MANPLFRTAHAPESKPRQSSGVRLVDAETRTFEWATGRVMREVTGELTGHDWQEIQRLNLSDMQVAIAAKTMWRDGVKVCQWPANLGVSLSYCRKLSMAFGRAERSSKFKK